MIYYEAGVRYGKPNRMQTSAVPRAISAHNLQGVAEYDEFFWKIFRNFKIANVTLASENWNEVHIQVLTSDFKVPEGVFYSLSDFRERNGSSMFNTELTDDSRAGRPKSGFSHKVNILQLATRTGSEDTSCTAKHCSARSANQQTNKQTRPPDNQTDSDQNQSTNPFSISHLQACHKRKLSNWYLSSAPNPTIQKV